MNKVCRRCGGEFFGHFNARFCGEECRTLAKRAYQKAYDEAHRKPPKPPEFITPFPDDIDREAFGHWLSGFADGEAWFGLRVHEQRGEAYVRPTFRIALRDDDAASLRLIRSYWQCGTLAFQDNRRSKIANAKPIAVYGIQRLTDLAGVVIPHFDRYPLRAKKRNDYAVWRDGVLLMAEVVARPLRYRPGHCPNRHGGTYPKWTAEEREKAYALSAKLSEGRLYAPAERTEPLYS